ncbi:two-component regulator propeller domain-containing protein [Haliea sp.]|uniref:two-component regulator propeller domain-containing protein n=1 Tax=Haliea sp. TaxID=1932666 RepID=UPI0035291BF8
MSKVSTAILFSAVATLSALPSAIATEYQKSDSKISNEIQASHISIREFSGSSNIRNTPVTEVLLDSYGRLWISTQSGIFLHDGQRAIPFSTRRGHEFYAPSLDITSLTEDSNGQIWATSTSMGLMKYSSQNRSFLPFSSVNHHGIADAIAHSSGALIFIAQDQVHAINISTGDQLQWITEAWRKSGIGNAHQILHFSGRNSLFVSGSEGLMEINIVERTSGTTTWSDLVQSIVSEGSSSAPRSRHASEEPKNFGIRKKEFPTDLEAALMSLRESSKNLVVFQDLIFLGTDKGLYAFTLNGSFFKRFTKSNSGLSGDHITALAADNRQLWIGTFNGLSRLTISDFKNFSRAEGAALQDVLNFSEDPDGNVWVATYNGLLRYSPESDTIKEAQSVFPKLKMVDDRVMAVSSAFGYLWIGTRRSGLVVFDTARNSTVVPELRFESSFAVASIAQLDSKTTLVGSYSHGLFLLSRIDEPQPKFESYHLLEEPILGIYPLESHVLAIGGSKIFSVQPDQKAVAELSLTKDGIPISMILTAVSQVSPESFLIGTQSHGVLIASIALHQSATIVEDVMTEILQFASAIYAIEKDDSGRFWIATSNGLFLYSSDLHFLRRFSRANHLQADNFNFGASLHSRDGSLYFGSNLGFTKVTPNSVTAAPSESRLYLNEITAGTQRFLGPQLLLHTETITLTHKDRFLTLNFSTRDLTDVEAAQYRHKLEGFEDAWVDIGNRGSATYTNLPPGSYVFKAQALNASGVWNPEGVSIGVTVKPAPWRTWWAYTLYGLFVLAIVYLMLRVYRERMLKEQAEKQADEMQRIADQFADEVQDQMDFQRVLADSMHRYNKELLAWANVCIRRSAEYAHGDVSALQSGIEYRLRVLDLVQDALYYRGEQLYLDPHAFVSKLFTLAAERHPELNQRLTAINDATNELLPASQAIPIAVIIGELFENSLHHSFAASQGPCYLRIALTMPSVNEVQLEIQDNGVGIPAGLSFEAAEFAGFAIVADVALAARGALKIGSDRKSVLGQFLLAEEPKKKDQRP